MEVVAASPGNGTPFHNHDVREWSRLDSLTGVLERARLETDHWAANTVNSSHKYNKVVDSRARSGVDGNLQQQARRKLEVFQSQVPGGRLQVIKTHTVSSSRWTGKSPTVGIDDNFEDLKLSLNPLDLTSEKSKASVGRSVGRRPPSRSRIRDANLHTAATTNLHRVSRLCHQVHNSAVRQAFGGHRISEHRQNGDGVEITEIDESSHRSLSRTKSTSSEDLHDTKKSLEDLEDLEQLQNWRRTSKIRRSLQYPKQKSDNKKPPDLPENTGSVRKIREDLETGRRLSTALRGNNLDLDALDQILKSISNSSVSSSYSDQKFEEPEKDAQITTTKKHKRDSFVTVESIQAVRDRLRRTSSPTLDVYKQPGEEIDDGIVTETTQKSEMNESRVKSYIYGMEKGKNISGTGSLESRSKPGNQSTVKNEDWFSRRKSYGFEQMHSQQATISSKNKRVESSTDSGICRSSEIVIVPTPTKTNLQCPSESEEDKSLSTVRKYALIFEKNKPTWNKKSKEHAKDVEATTITIPISSNRNFENHAWSENKDIRKTQVWSEQWSDKSPESNHWDQTRDLKNRISRNNLEPNQTWKDKEIRRNVKTNQACVESKDNNRNLEINHWNGQNTPRTNQQWKEINMPETDIFRDENGDIKRHSIAVDESKYINNKQTNQFKRTSLSINDEFEDAGESEQFKHINEPELHTKFPTDDDNDNINDLPRKYRNDPENRRKYANSSYRNTIQEGVASSFKNSNDLKEKYFGSKFNDIEDSKSYIGNKFQTTSEEEFTNDSDASNYVMGKYVNTNEEEFDKYNNKYRTDSEDLKKSYLNKFRNSNGPADSNQYINSKFETESDESSHYLSSKFRNEPEDFNKYPSSTKFKSAFEKCEDEDDANHRKQNKKVEFCKTEVHFAADSGRVNIVETDEKPPPTQKFRRRRRNSNLMEDFNRNGLPVLHFGDTSYEKLLFSDGDADLEKHENSETNEVVTCVTVNANGTYHQECEEQRENIENEIPKGILKNKPIKPRPYILGDNSLIPETEEEHEDTWGIQLRPPLKEETPLWRSTVTVRNTSFENHDQPEFQKLLKQLRPTSKKNDEDSKRNSDSDVGNIRILSPTVDTRRSSWSVADRIKQVEDLKWSETKGYSTKVNFGEGEATVVENRHPTWPRKEEYSKDLKRNLLNKGLVVRIGRNDSRNSKHTVCSKTTTNCDTNGTTTTTKITIDLTPSPVDDGDDFKFPKTTQAFKSPSLIMNTFKTEAVKTKMPQQLEALRKLYEEVHSDSEADKEVHQILMSKHQDESSSVVSGSWSKMRAFKHISHYQKTKNGSHALLEKDTNNKFQYIDAQIESDLKHLKIDEDNLRETKKQFSPIILKKSNNISLKSAFTHELSSPYLVRSRTSPYNSDTENNELQKERANKVEEINNMQTAIVNSNNIRKQVLDQHTISHKKQVVSENSMSHKKQVMTEERPKKLVCPENPINHKKHGIAEDPTNHKRHVIGDPINSKKQVMNEDTMNHRKPVGSVDQLNHKKPFAIKTTEQTYGKAYHQSRRVDQPATKEVVKRNKSPMKEKVVRQPKKSEMAYFGVKVSPKIAKKENTYSEKPDLVQCSSLKRNKENTPIYENVKPTFDSSILEELTKAADQILQAVNGYTDEEHHSKYTSEDELQKREPLDTISETKSWKQKTSTQTRSTAKTSTSNTRTKLKQTSSNSSIDSISRECRKLSTGSIELKKPFMTKSAEQKQRKKVVNGESAKARRLQRASSREALLQSHGSSSEDLASNTVEVVRKPRLVKKTKSAQLTISNGIELKKPIKKREEVKSKHEERVPVIGLPEIRHKTAVSTIRSTAEKVAIREKSKLKNDENKKKPASKRETTKGGSSSTLKPERTKGTVNRDYSHRHTSVTTQKKPIRTTDVGKH